MLFSSIPFLFYFLPCVLLLYAVSPRKFKNFTLLVCSLVFYAWGEPRLAVLMLITVFIGYLLGLLTDKYLKGIPSDSRIAKDGRFLHRDDLTDKRLRQIQALNEIAAERGQTLAEMAIAWILRDGKVCSALIGASRPSQIEDNVKALRNISFSEEELKKIDEISLA